MAAIITITPNPCIDISTSVEELIPDKKLLCTSLKKEPGGGGINVSKALKKLIVICCYFIDLFCHHSLIMVVN